MRKIVGSFLVVVTAAVLSALAGLNAQATEQEALAHSLFFTADAARQIDAMVSKDTPAAVSRPGIHLGKIMYYGPDDRILGLQGQSRVPGTLHDDLRIVELRPSQVNLELPSVANLPPQKITFPPHQTYHVATGKVVEGSAE